MSTFTSKTYLTQAAVWMQIFYCNWVFSMLLLILKALCTSSKIWFLSHVQLVFGSVPTKSVMKDVWFMETAAGWTHTLLLCLLCLIVVCVCVCECVFSSHIIFPGWQMWLSQPCVWLTHLLPHAQHTRESTNTNLKVQHHINLDV